QQVRLELAQPRTERVVKPGQVVVVAGSVGQVDVNRRGRLVWRIVIVLVQGDGEDVYRERVARIARGRGILSRRVLSRRTPSRGPRRRQRLARCPRAAKNR